MIEVSHNITKNRMIVYSTEQEIVQGMECQIRSLQNMAEYFINFPQQGNKNFQEYSQTFLAFQKKLKNTQEFIQNIEQQTYFTEKRSLYMTSIQSQYRLSLSFEKSRLALIEEELKGESVQKVLNTNTEETLSEETLQTMSQIAHRINKILAAQIDNLQPQDFKILQEITQHEFKQCSETYQGQLLYMAIYDILPFKCLTGKSPGPEETLDSASCESGFSETYQDLISHFNYHLHQMHVYNLISVEYIKEGNLKECLNYINKAYAQQQRMCIAIDKIKQTDEEKRAIWSIHEALNNSAQEEQTIEPSFTMLQKRRTLEITKIIKQMSEINRNARRNRETQEVQISKIQPLCEQLLKYSDPLNSNTSELAKNARERYFPAVRNMQYVTYTSLQNTTENSPKL